MRIGYSKLGRAWKLKLGSGTVTGGDIDVYRALDRLARRHPNVEWVLTGRNSGDNPQECGLPANVTNPWPEILPHYRCVGGEDAVMEVHKKYPIPLFEAMDQHVSWLGQHGTHNSKIPLLDGSGDSTTQANFFNYAGYIIHGLNAWRDANPEQREEIWLCPDPRNLLKCRDLKWPLENPIIAQYDDKRKTRHYRYDDPATAEGRTACGLHEASQPYRYTKVHDSVHVWEATTRYVYGALELTALPDPRDITCDLHWDDRQEFGIVLNENKPGEYRNSRLSQLKTWVLSRRPDAPVRGKWTADSQAKLGRTFTEVAPPQYLGTLRQWRCTLTTPASGSGWATAKPWEAFAAGTVCFFHPGYDTQNHILRGAPADLAAWLRVQNVDQLWGRIEHLNKNQADWEWLVRRQRDHFEERFAETRGGIAAIEQRLELT